MKGPGEVKQYGNVFLRDLTIGMSDGLIIPFALAAGLTAAQVSSETILLAGVAQIAAGSVLMGFGGYFSIKSEQEEADRKRKETLEKNADEFEAEQKKFLSGLGLNDDMQQQAIHEMKKDKAQWSELIIQAAINKSDFRRSAFTIGGSFVSGGLIPLLPFLFLDPGEALPFTAGITICILLFLGWIRAGMQGRNHLWGAIWLALIGSAAAAAAYGVARIFIEA